MLPLKSMKRLEEIAKMHDRTITKTLVLFETPHRIHKTLVMLKNIFNGADAPGLPFFPWHNAKFALQAAPSLQETNRLAEVRVATVVIVVEIVACDALDRVPILRICARAAEQGERERPLKSRDAFRAKAEDRTTILRICLRLVRLAIDMPAVKNIIALRSVPGPELHQRQIRQGAIYLREADAHMTFQ